MKLAIIGASYLQEPLIQKAKSMGIETHVFAWAADDVGEKSADCFYPISIIEKEKILKKCQEIGIDGICSIASDLAAITVNYVACNMGLVGNSLRATEISTNKNLMRDTFEKNNDPSPKHFVVSDSNDESLLNVAYPIIIKPTDRSGSRGVYKLEDNSNIIYAVESAIQESFEKKAIVEEYVEGKEYSVEFISYMGDHHFIALTEKFTTGAPHFIETGHREPAKVSEITLNNVKKIVTHALDSLELKNGASHSEVKIDDNGDIKIIEIGGRMGGDMIGSNLVPLSTGYDYVKAVIEVALGNAPEIPSGTYIAEARIEFDLNEKTTDSSNRTSYCIYLNDEVVEKGNI